MDQVMMMTCGVRCQPRMRKRLVPESPLGDLAHAGRSNSVAVVVVVVAASIVVVGSSTSSTVRLACLAFWRRSVG